MKKCTEVRPVECSPTAPGAQDKGFVEIEDKEKSHVDTTRRQEVLIQ
jgi:hypothetical protein